MPLVQGVPGLDTQDPGCLLLLEVFDEGHGSVGTGQVVASCRSESNDRKIFQDLKTEKIKPNRTDKSGLVIWKLIQLTFQRHMEKLQQATPKLVLFNLQQANVPDNLTLGRKYFMLGRFSLILPLNPFQPIQIQQ